MDTKQHQADKAAEIIKSISPLRENGEGLIIFVFQTGDRGRMTYVSTADRCDCITALMEWIGVQDPEILDIAMQRIADQRRFGPENTN
jgi:hypothetical protein